MSLDELLRQMRSEAAGGRAETRFWDAVGRELRSFFSGRFQPADRDDLAQLATLVIICKHGEYQQTGPDTFRRWVRAIASKVLLGWSRATANERAGLQRLLLQLSPKSVFTSPSSWVRRVEGAERLEEIEPELSVYDRQVLWRLLGVDDDSSAPAEDLTNTAARSRLHRAGRRIRQRIGTPDTT